MENRNLEIDEMWLSLELTARKENKVDENLPFKDKRQSVS